MSSMPIENFSVFYAKFSMAVAVIIDFCFPRRNMVRILAANNSFFSESFE